MKLRLNFTTGGIECRTAQENLTWTQFGQISVPLGGNRQKVSVHSPPP